MTRVLLTGGSGFVASHVLHTLLERGHSVVTTVRSLEKADKIKRTYANFEQNRLDFVIVKDIAQPGAFDQAVISDPSFQAVIHTASPVNLSASDVKRDLLDPAINGTTGILHSIKKYAPTITRVVITSSFASMLDKSKGNWPEHTYSEKDWNPITVQHAVIDPISGYEASKTFAEKAAWDFVQREQPKFTITTISPPMVLGPILHASVDSANLDVGNQTVYDFLSGRARHRIPANLLYHWVDVRDLALCHVLAVEKNLAENKRFLLSAGTYSHREIASILRKVVDDEKSLLPAEAAPGGDYPVGGVYAMDTSSAEAVFEIRWKTLEHCVRDMAMTLKRLEG